jgi:hypothetical protein
MTATTWNNGPETAPRTLQSDLGALRARLAAAVEAQPIAAVATAAVIGFALGSRLARPAIACSPHRRALRRDLDRRGDARETRRQARQTNSMEERDHDDE